MAAAATKQGMRLLGALATTCLLAACTPERPPVAPSVEGAGASSAPNAPSPVSLARLRLGPVVDGAVGPLVVDDGARSALVLASPIGDGRFRIELAIEGDGVPMVRTVAETLQAPRGFSLALTDRGGLLAWIEGERRSAVVSTVSLAADGAPLAGTRKMPQGRVEPYWVTARMEEGRRVLVVAEQDANGAALRVRALGDDGEPLAPPVAVAKRAVSWATHAELPVVLVREDGASLRLEAYALEARGAARLVAAARLEGVPARAVKRLDVSGRGEGLRVAVTITEPGREVLVFRASKGAFQRVGRAEGRALAADESSLKAAFLLAKSFPSREGAVDLAVAREANGVLEERVLPPSVALAGEGVVPPSVVSLGEGDDGFALTLGVEEDHPSLVRVDGAGAVSRASGALGVGPGWHLRLREGALRMVRFEARGAGVDVVDGPPEQERNRTEPGVATALEDDLRSLFATETSRIGAASLGETSYAIRLEPSAEAPKEGDLNAESLRLFALGERGASADDRITDRAQPTGTVSLAARSGSEPLLAVTWLARERGVQQAHAVVLDAKTCKVQPCDSGATAWPLARKRHRQITKAGGDVTEVVLIPTPEGFLGAWVEQSGREAAVVAATYDPALERTSKFERVSAAGSLATDLVASLRGGSVWLGWIEGKSARAEGPRAVPTLARVAMHDAHLEQKPRALTPRAGEGLTGALAMTNHEHGLLVAYLEREGLEAARRADEGEEAPAFLTLQLLDERGEPVGDPVQRGADGEGVPCDVALSPGAFALERCRPAAFTLEVATLVVTKDGVTLANERTVTRGLRPATQDRPVSVDDRRVLWLQNDEAGNPWLRSLPLVVVPKRPAQK